ncbi:TonB-dependent receptor plug domain-containing protein [Caulobacter sp. AP07]|uniref:TonB-dependent receptor plug domain-containing protein n=1 Tax=Caulobacter sp. AP07 TaxID=1144304 RepID=UPI0019309454|nr:TonB-dependent receptor [Caulobacter sp. AP07]
MAEVVVTGTRIARDGYKSPTALTVVTQEEIRTQAPTNNLADYVNQIPAVAGSLRPANTRLYLSNGLAGINALNLRNLGVERTLVLVDGRRSVGSSVTGAVDVNNVPQALVKSVEIVTGGASAAYGSDAVSGVVNFILVKDFTGLKATVEGGGTTHGDGRNYLVSAAGGKRFAGGRGHVMVSGEYAHRDGIFNVDRDWNQHGDRLLTNPNYTAPNGQPQYLVVTNAGTNNTLPGGIINSSAGAVANSLRGLYFGPGGSVNRYDYGALSNATTTVGGDWALADGNRRIGLDPQDDRRGVFGRVSFALTDTVTLFGEAAYNWNRSVSNAGPSLTSSYTLSASNPYLVAALGPTALAGVTSVTLGTSAQDFPYRKNYNTRRVQRFAVGGEGRFDAFGRDVRWDAYAQYGQSDITEMLRNILNTSRLALATDAVVAPGGAIVCRSTLTDPTNGCAPLNRLGVGVASAAAIDYVLGDPYRRQRFAQTTAGFNLSFDPFSTWAGPMSVATGAEYRREAVSGFVEAQYRSGWSVGNFLPTFGHYTVKEAYAEVAVPLGAGIDLNGAVRGTDYSTSGYVTTWKLGASYRPIDDLRFRLVRSRDIRAANLNELYQRGTSRTNSLNDPFNGNAATPFIEVTTGNPNLRPEVADTWTAGVIVQPRFMPGFTTSFDYFDIQVRDAIGQVYSQTIVNRCHDGLKEYCAAFTRTPGASPELSVNLSPFNFARAHAKAFDVAATYRTPLDAIAPKLPGDLTLRFSATHYIKNYINNGIDAPTDSAGAHGSGAPRWIYRLAAIYENDGFTATAVARGVSAGTIDNSYVVCSSGCPASTTAHPTINANRVAGAVYADLNLTKKVRLASTPAEAFLNITNLLDRDPVIIASGGLSTNPTYYDYLGRLLRFGMRFAFQ